MKLIFILIINSWIFSYCGIRFFHTHLLTLRCFLLLFYDNIAIIFLFPIANKKNSMHKNEFLKSWGTFCLYHFTEVWKRGDNTMHNRRIKRARRTVLLLLNEIIFCRSRPYKKSKYIRLLLSIESYIWKPQKQNSNNNTTYRLLLAAINVVESSDHRPELRVKTLFFFYYWRRDNGQSNSSSNKIRNLAIYIINKKLIQSTNAGL